MKKTGYLKSKAKKQSKEKARIKKPEVKEN